MPRLQLARILHLTTPGHRQVLSSPLPVHDVGGICRESLSPQFIVVWPYSHVSHHSGVENVLRYARYSALSGRMTVDCRMCGGPAAEALLPGVGDIEDSKPLPRQIRTVRAEDRLGDEDADGPLDPWHMLARRQIVRGGSAILLALQEDIARLRTPLSCLPAGGALGCATRGQYRRASCKQQFLGAHAGTRPIFGLWTLSVGAALGPSLGCGP